jgi:multiple sugar transport system substrate-binding protein
VRALTWLRDYYQRFSPSLAELNSGLPSGRNRFTAGREAMRFSVTGELFDYLTAAPDVSIGLGKMPYDPASGVTDPAWVGGHTLAIPKAAKNPDAGWEFLRFVTADPEGSTAWAQGSGWFPGYLRSPVFREKFARDPYLGPYMQILLGATNQRPVMPVQKRYWEELDSALNDVFALAIQPLEALQRVSQRVQDELATVMSGE